MALRCGRGFTLLELLIVIAICHNDRPKFQILATLAYATAASAAFFVILAHDRPFIGSNY